MRKNYAHSGATTSESRTSHGRDSAACSLVRRESPDQIEWVKSLPLLLLHAACLLVFCCGFSWAALAVCALLFALRVGSITAGFHRYFSHRTYKTTRAFQFLIAWIATSATQKGPLWWAANHRQHHAHSDTEVHAHSPRHEFWWSHAGWFLSGRYSANDFRLIPPSSERQGFFWWEIKVTHYVLTIFSWMGLAWDLNRPPKGVYHADVSLDNGTASVP